MTKRNKNNYYLKKEVLFSVVYFAVCVFPKLDEIERVGFEPTYISI